MTRRSQSKRNFAESAERRVATALVIGYGSIGQRHVRILGELGWTTSVVSSQDSVDFPIYNSVHDAMDGCQPSYVVVASPTAFHSRDVHAVLDSGYQGPILIEKPLFSTAESIARLSKSNVFVGYNLRFLKVIQRLRELISPTDVISMHVYNGEYLPDWRPQRDYRATSSALRSLGGGVLRDLSHEIDFLHYLIGAPNSVSAVTTTSGTLEIETEDTVSAVFEHQCGAITTLALSYLDRIRRREIHITTRLNSVKANLLNGRVSIGNREEDWSSERDDTFREMHRDILSGSPRISCSLSEGLDVVRTIDMIELSGTTREWVNR